jgi:hypothetical protein
VTRGRFADVLVFVLVFVVLLGFVDVAVFVAVAVFGERRVTIGELRSKKPDATCRPRRV